MAHAERCPICSGKGKIEQATCHGCNGKGWVEVQDHPQPHFKINPPPEELK